MVSDGGRRGATRNPPEGTKARQKGFRPRMSTAPQLLGCDSEVIPLGTHNPQAKSPATAREMSENSCYRGRSTHTLRVERELH